MSFCHTRIVLVYTYSSAFKYVHMSNEAHFVLNGNVNKQNCRIWSNSNPQILHHMQLHLLSVIVQVLQNSLLGLTFSKKTVLLSMDSVIWKCCRNISFQNYTEWESLSNLFGFNKKELNKSIRTGIETKPLQHSNASLLDTMSNTWHRV